MFAPLKGLLDAIERIATWITDREHPVHQLVVKSHSHLAHKSRAEWQRFNTFPRFTTHAPDSFSLGFAAFSVVFFSLIFVQLTTQILLLVPLYLYAQQLASIGASIQAGYKPMLVLGVMFILLSGAVWAAKQVKQGMAECARVWPLSLSSTRSQALLWLYLPLTLGVTCVLMT
jgi:hypothetical protein